MKRLTALLLSILMLSSLCTAFAENSSDFSYDPGYSGVSESAVSDSSIQGEFTESGYVNEYFMLSNLPVNASKNNISEIKTDDEIKQYVQSHDFYTLFDDGNTTIAIFKADRYGSAVSESQFLNLFMEKASSYPWSKTANSQDDEKRIGESEFDYKYIPTLYLNGIYSFAFIRDGYVLLISGSDSLNSMEYDFNRRIEADVKSWKNIDSVCVNNGYAIGVKTDGSTVTAGILPNFAESVRDWKNIKKIVSCYSDTRLLALTKDGRLLSINAENYYAEEETPDYTYENIGHVIDIAMKTGICEGRHYALCDDGSVIFYNSVFIEDEPNGAILLSSDEINEYLEAEEKIEKIYAGSLYDTNGIYLLSNKGNVFAIWPEASEITKLDAADICQIIFTLSDSSRNLIYLLTEAGTIKVFNDTYLEPVKDINEYSNISQIALVADRYSGSKLFLIDSNGTPTVADTSDLLSSTLESAECEATYTIAAWKNIKSIETNNAEYPCCIGIKKDGTAVCAYTQELPVEETASSETAVPQREKPFPTDVNVDNYVKVTASEVYNEVKRGVDNRIFTRKFVDENRIEVIANPETGTVRRITLLKDSYGSEYDKSFYYDKEGNLVFVLYDSPELSHRMYIYDDVMIFWKETKAGETNSVHHEMENTAKYYEVEQNVLQESEELLKIVNGPATVESEDNSGKSADEEIIWITINDDLNAKKPIIRRYFAANGMKIDDMEFHKIENNDDQIGEVTFNWVDNDTVYLSTMATVICRDLLEKYYNNYQTLYERTCNDKALFQAWRDSGLAENCTELEEGSFFPIFADSVPLGETTDIMLIMFDKDFSPISYIVFEIDYL